MPAQKSVNPVLARYGQRLVKGVEAHKGDSTEYSQFGELPAGIENGIARLVDCKFTQIGEGKKNAGEWMFYAAGAVLAPAEHAGVPIEGLRTQISEILCDTPDRTGRKTVEEHIAWVLNEIRKLGVETKDLSAGDLEATLSALKEAQPTFRFRTWVGQATPEYPNPRTNHTWNGRVDYNGDVDPTSAVTHAPSSRNGSGTAPPASEEPEPEAEDTQEEPAAADDYQLSELAQAAEAGDEAARKQLTDLAVAAGSSLSEVENAPDWEAVARMAGGSPEASEEESEEEEPEATAEPDFEPTKEDVYKYQVLDPKTRKPLTDPKTKKPRKPIEVEVTAVDKKAKTVTLKSLEDGKTLFSKVPWSDLIQ